MALQGSHTAMDDGDAGAGLSGSGSGREETGILGEVNGKQSPLAGKQIIGLNHVWGVTQ